MVLLSCYLKELEAKEREEGAAWLAMDDRDRREVTENGRGQEDSF